MGKKKKSPKVPDYSQFTKKLEDMAQKGLDISDEQMEWARKEFAGNKDLLQDFLGMAMPAMGQQWLNSQKDRERYEKVFQPLQDEFIEMARGYDTPERRTLAAGEAMADTGMAADAQREQQLRQLESYGIDPSQTRYQALDANMRAQQAAAQAGAGQQARRETEQRGQELLGAAIGLGSGLPAQSIAGLQAGLGAGQAGLGQSQGVSALGGQLMGTAPQWFAQAMGGMSDAQRQQMEAAMQQYQQQQSKSGGFMKGLGGIAGSIMGGPVGGAIGNWAGSKISQGLGGTQNANTGAWIFSSEGGVIPGELVEGPGGPKDDAIPAKLSDGEYVIPAEVVLRKGTEFFDKLVDKTQMDVQQNARRGALPGEDPMEARGIPVEGLAQGGTVGASNQMPQPQVQQMPQPQPPTPVQYGSDPMTMPEPEGAIPPPMSNMPVGNEGPFSFSGMDSWRDYTAMQQPAATPVNPIEDTGDDFWTGFVDFLQNKYNPQNGGAATPENLPETAIPDNPPAAPDNPFGGFFSKILQAKGLGRQQPQQPQQPTNPMGRTWAKLLQQMMAQKGVVQ